VYYHTITYHKILLTFASFYSKIIGNYVILHWCAISSSKNNYRCFVLETNTGDVGCFLQVQHYWVSTKYRSMKITHDFSLKLKPSRAYHKIDTFRGEQRWMGHNLVSPWRMYCMYSGMAKGTSQAEVTSNSEKIKPVALAIVELCESEGISQSGS